MSQSANDVSSQGSLGSQDSKSIGLRSNNPRPDISSVAQRSLGSFQNLSDTTNTVAPNSFGLNKSGGTSSGGPTSNPANSVHESQSSDPFGSAQELLEKERHHQARIVSYAEGNPDEPVPSIES